MIRANSPTQLYSNDLVTSFDANTTSRIRRNKQTVLPDDFEPSSYDVLCGRDKTSFNHVGNRRFRVTIAMNLKKYMEAKTKIQKTLVVVSIVDMIRSLSPNGGFVKQGSDGKWYEIGDKLARAKVGHALRDLIVSKKKSGERNASKENQRPLSQQAIIQHKKQQSQLHGFESPINVRSTVLNNVHWRQKDNNDRNDYDGMRKSLNSVDEELEPVSMKDASFNAILDNDYLLLESIASRTSSIALPESTMDSLFDGVLVEPDPIGSASEQQKRVSDVLCTMAGIAQRRRVSYNEAV